MPKKQATFSPDVLITLERGSGQSLTQQIITSLRTSIQTGTLAAESCLPASRLLAHDLAVSRNVIVEAYEQLIAEGYLTSRPRSGTRVAILAKHDPATNSDTSELPISMHYDFRPGIPDTRLFPRTAWGAAMRQVLQTTPASLLDYGDPRGALEARHEIAAYLRRARGTITDPAHLLLTTGFAQGLSLLCQVLKARGLTRLAMEEPTHSGQRALIRQAGLEVIGIPVDAEGIQVDALMQSNAQAVLITPAHQFPLGVVLSPARRQALLHWARTHDAFIIEDDYDAEYRYDRAPVGALQGLDVDHVIYGGSVSKMLAPALRIGWLIVPDRLLPQMIEAKRYTDLSSSVLDQLTFSLILADGQLDRHLRRVRQIYRNRRDILVTSVIEHIPGAAIQGIAAGLHVVVTLPDAISEEKIIAQASSSSIGLYGLHSYCQPAPSAPAALVMGYAALSEVAIKTSLKQLGQLLQEVPAIKERR
ncbi:GntR family transcriptional regulator [Dictyobacter alpinus]|uniref:GntR family transcriptional regulator n=1 Tax=Dictyobacter alpinus TaxID=2014873 RepID=A0A402BG06_9CHLR|nr:PLP-dependent aminotransferase family protein [Dictyobacter alpinus]GCE30276.1 GntR family transcriptional regulator [Dictyobacter alpinus]